jgi:hypothetical protein
MVPATHINVGPNMKTPSTIIHRHAILEYDGLDSTDDFPEIITEHFFDLQHDHNFTKCAQQQIKQYLDSISYTLKIV